ncbi:MAG: hypothetical protein PVH21_14110 [Myxococcales bacterium]|jgi:hypothetical protein
MPMRGDRTKRERDRGRNRDLDWFAEDPWSEPGLASFEDNEDGWDLDTWGAIDEDLDETPEDWEDAEEDESSGEESLSEDDYDGWGPVRRRTKQRRRG